MDEKLKEESNVIEYKISLPTDSKKWLKSIVSFSNTSGGELIIGVDDSTLEVVGVDEPRALYEAKIRDTIYNGIKPMPFVDIEFRNMEGKSIVIVQVSKGAETPYYLKKEGPNDGTYVRFRSTDRKATKVQIDELILNKEKKSYTSEVFQKENSSADYIDKEIYSFLSDINKIRVGNEITESKLIQWGILHEEFGKKFPTNGYMLLTSNPVPSAYIKIGLFSGTNKAKLIFENRIQGPIISQFHDALEEVKKILNEGFDFRGIRTQLYTIPELALREIIANAIVHRNYKEDHPIRIEIFSNRLEVYSPGSLYDGIQLEDIEKGISKLRNGNIGEVFYNVGIIEKWGSGIQRANDALNKSSMNSLKLDVDSLQGVTVTIYYGQKEKDTEGEISQDKDPYNVYIQNNKTFKRSDLQREFAITDNQARRILEKWLLEKVIEKIGRGPSTHYKVLK